jgi:hypothetical protein
MDKAHETHLEKIKTTTLELIDKKYRQGQEQHGGNLWLKPGLIDEAINEAIDQVTYLLTLKDQIETLKGSVDKSSLQD